MKKLLSRRILLLISLLTAVFLFVVVYQLKILPLKYYILMVAVVLLILLLLYIGEKDKEKEHTLRVLFLKLIHIAVSAGLVFTSLVALQGGGLLSSITGAEAQVIEMNVIVLKEASYKKLEDLEGKLFGANTSLDAVNINKTETLIEEEIGNIEVINYDTYDEVIASLENDTIQAMIIKAVDSESLEDVEKNFNEKVRVIQTFELKIPSAQANSAKVTQEPFHIFVSGTDKTGPISTFALSDVNMIVTINPQTKQIYLTSIPRDYYVDIIKVEVDENGKTTEKNIGKDKLTHSAKFGVQSTIRTVENLMGIEINYYAKFNFTSFMNIVDALGGITIDIPKYDVHGNNDGIFTTRKGHYTMKPGLMDMNAKQALSFVRERYSFVEGDAIRGQNQMIMLKAIVKKCCSPAIITKLDSVFESLSSSFETNMSADEVKSLINMQLDDNAPWDIQSYHLSDATSERAFTLATIGDVRSINPNGLFVAKIDEESVRQAKEYMDIVMSGKLLKIDNKKEE